MPKLTKLFDDFNKYFKNEPGVGINLHGTIYQHTIAGQSLIIGRDTLRLVYSDNEKNAIIAFTPCHISVGTYEREIELELSVLSSNLSEKYSRLYVDGGELFQLSTVHDFDFLILKDILAKYLELLRNIKDSPRIKGEQPNIDQAIQYVSDAVELYKKEA